MWADAHVFFNTEYCYTVLPKVSVIVAILSPINEVAKQLNWRFSCNLLLLSISITASVQDFCQRKAKIYQEIGWNKKQEYIFMEFMFHFISTCRLWLCVVPNNEDEMNNCERQTNGQTPCFSSSIVEMCLWRSQGRRRKENVFAKLIQWEERATCPACVINTSTRERVLFIFTILN